MKNLDDQHTILIVEDDLETLHFYTRFCANQGYAVNFSINGDDAVLKARTGKPDLILLDIFLPGLDGIAICKTLKQDVETRDIPIIVITNIMEYQTRIETLEAGANDFLTKPVDTAELAARVGNLIKIRDLEEMRAKNEILLQSMQTIEKTKLEWEQTLDNISDIVMLVDENKSVLRCNKPFTKLTGKSYSELLGGNWETLLIERGFSASTEKNESTTYTLANKYWYKCTTYETENFRISEKKVTVVTLHDITESKGAERALKESEEKYRTIFENATEGIFQSSPDGRILHVNPAMARMLGSSTPEEHIEFFGSLEKSSQYVNLDERKRFKGLLHEQGVVTGFETQLYRKDKTIIWVSMNAHTVHDSEGNLLYYEGTAVDISAHKAFEEKLKESEERYRVAIEYSNDAIALVADIFKPCYLYVNNRFLKMFGYSVSEIIGRPAITIIHPDDRETFIEYGRGMTDDGKTELRYEIKGIQKNGTTLYLDTSLTVTPYKGQKAVLIYLRDTTERHLFEEKLIESEERYRVAIEQSHDGVALIADGLHIYVNRRFVEMFGYSRPEEIIGRSGSFIVHPDDMERVEEYRRKRQRGEAAPNNYEMKGIKRNGDIVFIEIAAMNIIFRGKPTILAYLRDITDRKRAEEIIRVEQEKFEALAENAPLGLVLIEADGSFSYRNKRFREMFGYDDKDIPNGREWFRRAYPNPDYCAKVKSAWLEDVETISKTEVGYLSRSWDFTVNCKNGTRKIINFTTSHLASGQHLMSCGDITERARAQEALVQERERFEKLTENAPFGVVLIGKDNSFEYMNQKFIDLFGYNISDTPTARDWIRKVYPDPKYRQLMKDSWREDLANDTTQGKARAYTLICKDGNRKAISFLSVRLKTGEFMMTCADITERKKAEEELEQSHDALKLKNIELEKTYLDLKSAQSAILQSEKMASIGQLAAGIAHEINNPVGFIMSNLNSLGKYIDRISQFVKTQSEAMGTINSSPEKAATVLEEVQEIRKSSKIDYMLDDLDDLLKESLDGTERVKRIVQDLKSFAHIDEAEWKISDINAGLKSTINIVWNELKYKATVDKDFEEIPMTKCNLGQLNQVFLNLLVNAAQAIDQKGEIRVRTRHENKNIVITISDTGSGISPDKINRIFEPFFTTKEVGKGTGLGLSIAYDIIKKHNGEISVESEIDKGTTFTIAIPVVEG